MTLIEAINHVDNMKPNQYTKANKVKWLSDIDGIIFREIISTHEGNTMEDFTGYAPDAADTTVLLVPYPYDVDIYNYYLQSMIDKENGEYTKYNQSATMYNNAFRTFQDWYNRTHRPLPCRSAFRF